MIPIRCYTCGNLLSSKYNIHKTIQHRLENKTTEELIAFLKLPNYCCNIYFIEFLDNLYKWNISILEEVHNKLHE